ncbi:unnamed protein product [Camellia sinensis]
MAKKVGSSERGSRWSLAGMTAFVTGGTRGIGHDVAEELADKGAIVHTCSRNESELNGCLQEWSCINNVGTTLWKPTMEYSAEEYSMRMATNGNSAFHLCQLAHPLLKTSGGVGKHCVYFFRCWLGAHRFRIRLWS